MCFPKILNENEIKQKPTVDEEPYDIDNILLILFPYIVGWSDDQSGSNKIEGLR